MSRCRAMVARVWGRSHCSFVTGLITLAVPTVAVAAEQRFPPPDFTTGHTLPSPTMPHPDGGAAVWWGYLDVAMLLLALSLATWLMLKKRSRKGMAALSIGALVYFGFYRHGCVCAIGSIQNVSLAMADSSYVIPLTVLAFFLLPLVFALFVGRAFCAGVCPLGAMQDLVLIKPLRLPKSLDAGLGLLPYVYLGGAVLLAATGSRFIICEYDPFVGFFRMSGERAMLLFGGVLLLLATFIGRPYCRFLCPYGVLLRHLSRFSKWHLSVTPSECIQCHLCADACPFNAIDAPAPDAIRPTPAMRRRVLMLAIALPGMMLAGAWLVGSLSPHLARLHPEVARVEQVLASGAVEAAAMAEMSTSVSVIQRQLVWGGYALGAFLGLVIGGRLLRLSVTRPNVDYTANRADCFSCARCVDACPKEHQRRGDLPVPLVISATSVGEAGT